MSNYVFSTLTCDQRYQNYVQGGGDLPVPTECVFIKGGTGVANDRFVTPIGVATEVTDEELAALEKNYVFGLHKKNGFITVSQRNADPEKVAADMCIKDKSAPLTEADYVNNDGESAPMVKIDKPGRKSRLS